VNCAALRGLSALKLSRRDIANHLSAVEAEKGPVTAARVRTALSACFNWAIREGYEIPSNPVAGTNRPPEPPSRSRVLTDAELAQLWHALPEGPFGDIIRLLILTGQRREEIGGLRWDEVGPAELTLPPERTKNRRTHTIPLAPTAAAILARQARLGQWVFGPGGSRRYATWTHPKAALPALAAPWRIHDIRRSVATGMAELGVLPHVIEAVLNHVSGSRAGVAGIYNRARYSEEMRTALERWSEHVAPWGYVSGPLSRNDVRVGLRKRAYVLATV
jgi:integrase